MKNEYVYVAKVNRVVDGDTLEVLIDLGFKIGLMEMVRIYGINTPELHSQDPSERLRAQAARADAQSILDMVGGSVTIRSHKGGAEKYGRWLAEVFLPNGQSLGNLLIEHGHAVAYDGGKR